MATSVRKRPTCKRPARKGVKHRATSRTAAQSWQHGALSIALLLAVPSLMGFTDAGPTAPDHAKLPQPAPQPATKKPDGTVATFIGLRQLGDSRTLIYVELTKPVEPVATSKGRTLEYTLPKTQVTLRNNRRPLLARHFDSVVHSAQLVPDGKDLKLVIQLREDAQPKTRVVRHAQGATFEVELARSKPPSDPRSQAGS